MDIIPGTALAVILQHWSWVLSLVSAYFYSLLLNQFSNHWLVELARTFDFAPLEQACASYHHQSGPGAAVVHTTPRLVRALLVKYLFNLSLRQLEEMLKRDLLLRWFVGYGLFQQPPDHTTLERFEQWVIANHPRLFFDEVLRQIDRDCPQDHLRPQIVDSYAMLARAAKVSLIPLLRDTVRQLLRKLQQVAPERHALVLSELNLPALFGEENEKDDYFLTSDEREARLQAVVNQALRCRRLLTEQLAASPLLPPERLALVQEWLANLSKILGDEVTIKPLNSANPEEVEVKERPTGKKGSYRLASANDPEATYRDHGKNKPAELAYNVSVMATPQFIREIQADTGAQPDPVALPEMLATQKEQHHVLPPKAIGDMAYGNGKTRAQVEKVSDYQCQVVAGLPSYDKRTDRFTPYDFTLSADGSALICPNGITSHRRYRSPAGEGDDFRFTAALCQGCPFWQQCRDSKSKPDSHRMVFVSDYRPQVEAAREYNKTDDFKKDMKLRPLIERVIYNLTNIHSGRRASRTGKRNADFQARMNATAFNLRQWMRLCQRRVLSQG